MVDETAPLNLPDGAAADKDLEKLRTLRTVRDRLRDKGVPINMKPEFDIPEVPTALSEISDAELGDLYSKLLSWDNYFNMEMALSEADVKEKKNILQLVTVKIAEGRKKAEIEADPRIQDAKAELQQAEQEAKILKTTHSIFSNKMKVVSRTIELRKVELEKSLREASVQRGYVGEPRHSRFASRKKGKS